MEKKAHVQVWYRPLNPYTGLDSEVNPKVFGKGEYFLGGYPRIDSLEALNYNRFEEFFKRICIESCRNSGVDLQFYYIGISLEEQVFMREKMKLLLEKIKPIEINLN